MLSKAKEFLFKNTSTKQTMIKNTVWFAGGTTVVKVIRALVIILVARALGTEGYGIFTYALSLAGIVSIFSDIGLTGILTRELSKSEEKKPHYLSTTLIVKLGILIIATLILLFVGPLISKFAEAKPLLIVVAFSIAFESLRSFFYSITRSQNKMQVEAGISLLTEIISTALVVFMVFNEPTPLRLAYAYMIGNGLGLLSCILFLRTHFKNMWQSFEPSLVLPIIRSALPFAVMGVFGMFLTHIDAIMIGMFGTAHDVGLYAAAQRPLGLLYILPNFISISILPIMSRMVAEQEASRATILLKKSYLITFGLALPITLCGIILAQPLINVAFDQAYIGAVVSFQILLGTLLFVFSGSVFSDLILAENKQKIFMFSSATGAIMNVGLNLFLIPRFGIAGSATATLIAQICMNGLLYYEIRKRHTFSLFKHTGKIFLATLLIGALTYVLKSWAVPLLVIIPSSIAVYLATLILLKDGLVLEIKSALKL